MKKTKFIIYYNNKKCILVLIIYISLLYFLPSFFKKQKITDLKKACRSKFCNIIVLFFLKVGSVAQEGQHVNLVLS